MTVFDHIVLVLIGVSILVGLMRGAIKEVFSIAGWVLAFYAAKTWNIKVVEYMPQQIPGHAIKVMAAFVIVFLAILFLSSVASIVLTSFIKSAGLGGLNRVAGGFVGALRGLLFVCILVMLAGMTDIPKDVRWTNAMLSAPLETLVLRMHPWMPETLWQHIHFAGQPEPSAF